MNPSHKQIIAHFFIALFLVVAQGALLVHQVDLEAHADNSVCEVCIHHGSSDSAAPANTISFPSLFSTDKYLIIPAYTAVVAKHHRQPPPRAPPHFAII